MVILGQQSSCPSLVPAESLSEGPACPQSTRALSCVKDQCQVTAHCWGLQPFPPTQGNLQLALQLLTELPALGVFLNSAAAIFFFYCPVFLDKLCLQIGIEVLMMQGYALGTGPHSAVAQHALLLVTWSSVYMILAVEGHQSSSPLIFGTFPSPCGVFA